MNINKYIAEQFANPYGIAGRIVTEIMNRQNRSMYDETVKLMSPGKNEKIFDIGCGNGFMLNMLADKFDGVFYGIDISENILTAAKKRCRNHIKNGKIFISAGSSDKIPYDDKSFDKAYTVNTVYFWDDLNKTMAEIKRILKPGGLFINALYTNETLSRFSHTQFGYKRFTEEQIIKSARRSGFRSNVTPIMNGTAYCVVCVVE